ncbi:MAG: hypothetical protein ABIT37_17100 [Luteolibacter sp.]
MNPPPTPSTVRLPATPAHQLFSPEQVFLWLPGFTGTERAYCTYNEFSSRPNNPDGKPHTEAQDHHGVSYSPRFPLSRETHIAWHTDVSPPYPYHPFPIARSLSRDEMNALARQVIELLDGSTAPKPDPLSILRNEYKCHIVAALSKLGLLPSATIENQSGLRTAS